MHIIGAPHFFLNRGPARSKSGPDKEAIKLGSDAQLVIHDL